MKMSLKVWRLRGFEIPMELYLRFWNSLHAKSNRIISVAQCRASWKVSFFWCPQILDLHAAVADHHVDDADPNEPTCFGPKHGAEVRQREVVHKPGSGKCRIKAPDGESDIIWNRGLELTPTDGQHRFGEAFQLLAKLKN